MLSGGWVEGVGYHDQRYDCTIGVSRPTDNLAWAMVYGTISGGGTQTITVKWPRIIDRKELTATFDITVTAGSDSGTVDDGGGDYHGGGGGNVYEEQ